MEKDLIIEDVKQEPTEFEKIIQNITDIQAEWDKPQEPTEIQPLTPEQIAEMERQNKIAQEKIELEKEADELRKDFDQDYAGLFVPDIDAKKDRYRHINTRLREINGKEPRILK